MLHLRNVLVATDFSEAAEAALTRALQLARLHKTTVHLVFVAPPSHPVGSPFAPIQSSSTSNDAFHAWAKLALRALQQDVPQNKSISYDRVRIITLHAASPSQALLRYAEAHKIDLIVMGAHGHRPFYRFLLGSVAEEVSRSAKCPVLTVPTTKESIKCNGRQTSILVPLDFSDCSQHALAHAKMLAALLQARLILLHISRKAIHASATEQQLRHVFEAVPGPVVDAEFCVIPGYPAQSIVSFIEQHRPDWVVISTHGHTGMRSFFMGSVTQKVIRHAHASVLTIKAYGKSLISYNIHDFQSPKSQSHDDYRYTPFARMAQHADA